MSKQEAKVFIGGLSWETTGELASAQGPRWHDHFVKQGANQDTVFADEKLRRYFENYGAVQVSRL